MLEESPTTLVTVKGAVNCKAYVAVGVETLCGDWWTDEEASGRLAKESMRKTAELVLGAGWRPDLRALDQQWLLRALWHFPENFRLSNAVVLEAVADLKAIAAREQQRLVLVVNVRSDADLLSLRKHQTGDTVLICAAANARRMFLECVSEVCRRDPLLQDWTTLAKEGQRYARALEGATARLYCKMQEGVEGAFYGCWFVDAPLDEAERECLERVQERFQPVPPRVFYSTEAVPPVSGAVPLNADGVCCSKQPIGNLSWRCFGGPGLVRVQQEAGAITAGSLLDFSFQQIVEVAPEGQRFICDLCETVFHCKDDPLRKFANTYCSMKCLITHRENKWLPQLRSLN